MAKDTVYVEWHLKPRGWVRGNWTLNKPFQSSFPHPTDRVETELKMEITHDNNFVNAQKEWALTWVAPQFGDAERQVLRATVHIPYPRRKQ